MLPLRISFIMLDIAFHVFTLVLFLAVNFSCGLRFHPSLCLDLVVVDSVLYSCCSLKRSAVELSFLSPKWLCFDLGISYRVNKMPIC